LDYKNINDYELIYQIRENDEVAYETLFDKYSFIVNKLAYEYYSKNKNIGIEYDDLCQEGFFAISSALKEYNQDTSLFYTYVILCIKREMERLIKYHRRYKQMILSNSVSISSCIDGSSSLFLEEVIPSNFNVEETVISDDIYNKLLLYKHNLKFEESLVYELKVNKFTNKEIASLLDISYKKVDNHLRRIRNILLKYKMTL